MLRPTIMYNKSFQSLQCLKCLLFCLVQCHSVATSILDGIITIDSIVIVIIVHRSIKVFVIHRGGWWSPNWDQIRIIALPSI